MRCISCIQGFPAAEIHICDSSMHPLSRNEYYTGIVLLLIGLNSSEIWNKFYLGKLKLIYANDDCGVSGEVALRKTSLVRNYDKSTLVQVMAWCRQATSHYLSQCWPRSVSPYGVTWPQWVTYWGRSKMTTILQVTFWNTFRWMEIFFYYSNFT